MTSRRFRLLDAQAGLRRVEEPLDLVSLALAGLRRWRLVVPLLLVTLVLAWALDQRIPAQLEARGHVLLVALEATESSPVRGVRLDEVASELTNLAVQGDLAEGDSEITARARGRSVEVEVTGPHEEAVQSTFRMVSQWLRDNVEERQAEADVPPLERFALQLPTDITPTQTPDGRTTIAGRARLEEPAALQLNPHGANRNTVSLLAAIAGGDAARATVAAQLGDGVTYEVGYRRRDAAPVIQITSVAGNGRDALAAYDAVADVIEAELESLEARAAVPYGARTVVDRISPPRAVEDIGPTMERPVAAILGLGGLLTIGLVLLLEARDRARLAVTDDELRRGNLLFPPADLRVPPIGGPTHKPRECRRSPTDAR